MDWLGAHPGVIWFGLMLLLGSAEMLTGDLILLMLAAGALAGGVTAFIVPEVLPLQVGVGVVVALLSMFLLRPPLLAQLRTAKGYRSSIDRLRGSEATVTGRITGSTGEVKVNGEIWTARPEMPGLVIEAGTTVEITAVDGTTLKVFPRGEITNGRDPYRPL